MNWYTDLYAGPLVKDRVDELKAKVESGTCSPSLKVITTAYNGKDNLDIRPALSLSCHEYLRDSKIMIVGLAGNMSEALDLVGGMAQECLKETGSVNLREFFMGRS